jgi:hypothetical protein
MDQHSYPECQSAQPKRYLTPLGATDFSSDFGGCSYITHALSGYGVACGFALLPASAPGLGATPDAEHASVRRARASSLCSPEGARSSRTARRSALRRGRPARQLRAARECRGPAGVPSVGGRPAGGCGLSDAGSPGCWRWVAGAGLPGAGCWLCSAGLLLCDVGLRTLRHRIRDAASGFANSPPYKQNPPTQGGKASPSVSLGVAGDSFGVVRAGLWMSRANVDNSKNRARTAESPRARGRNAGAGGISTGADRGVSARKL